mmetsp:Transcript_36483/g.45024  ORF Transcript_36483/g.45024 Transcript_36483/m.45024 type:complete len:351 (+) Transcript_36483:723-1775(+)
MGQTHLRNGLFKGFHEQPANDLSLLLGLHDPGQLLVEVGAGIQDLELHARDVLFQAFLDDLGLVLSQQSSVHHEGPKAISNRFMHQGCRHAGVNTSTDGAHHVLVLQFVHDDVNLLLAEVVHVPLTLAANHLQNKVLDHLSTRGRVCHLGMELHAIDVTHLVLNGCELSVGGVCNRCEAWRNLRDLVAMAHPHWHPLTTDALEDGTAALDLLAAIRTEVSHIFPDEQVRMSKLALHAGFHLATQGVTHLLETVANAKDWQLLLFDVGPDLLRKVRGILVVHRMWSTTKNDAIGVKAGDLIQFQKARPQFAVDARFSHATANQVADLGSEIDHQNSFLLLHTSNHVNSCLG